MNDLKNKKTRIMGILNLTPDSFFDGGEYLNIDSIKNRIKYLKKADIIDVGAESTRPGSIKISEEEELERLSLLGKINNNNNIFSIDSYKYNVIKKCLENGFRMVNDISGGGKNFNNIDLAFEYDAHIVIMHMLGNPRTMQVKPKYISLIDEINFFFEKRIEYCYRKGYDIKKIILDPGIGFGKTIKDNDKIILNLKEYKKYGCNLLVGLSRKSFLSYNNDNPNDRLPQSVGIAALAAYNGADIVRVHDIEETVSMLTIIDRIKDNS